MGTICLLFALLFVAAVLICFIMGARKLEEEREELEHLRRLEERMKEVLDGEPT